MSNLRPVFKGILLLTLVFFITHSSLLVAKELTIKDVAEAEQRSSAVSENKTEINGEIVSNSTPLSTLLDLRDAINDKNWQLAATYLDLRYVEQTVLEQGGEKLIRKLLNIWRQQKILDLSTVSDNPKGHLDDNLPVYRDLIGHLTIKDGEVPVYMQRVPDDKGRKVWKISNATVSQIPKLWHELGYNPLIESLSAYLPEFELFGLYNWQVISLLLIVILSWFLSALVRTILQKLFSYSGKYRDFMNRFIRIPLRMFLFFIFIHLNIGFLGLPINTRVWLESGVLNYLAGIFLALGIIELTTAILINKTHNKDQSLAIIRPLISILKIVTVIIIILNWFEKAGYNVTTIITGLGIGSLAVALAAQKTLENVFGAFTMYLAKPIQAGDFCQFGEITGTVEEIGLRSTRIRKLNRSVVFVPNSVFASSSVENFSEIDRRLYLKELRIALDSTPDQLRHLLIALRSLIVSHPKILDDAARARFEDIERDCFLIVINAYIDTRPIAEYKAIAEDLNLRILEIIAREGVKLAIPEQHLFLSRTQPGDNQAMHNAQNSIAEMTENSQLPFPDFSQEQINTIKDSIHYPPNGSVIAPSIETSSDVKN